MATKDFRASQIETSKIIGTGSIAGTKVGIAIYSGSVASNREGGTTDAAMFGKVGSDVFLFISGSRSNNDFSRTDATLFGGDVVISGTLYAERQVIEVDSVSDGDFFVTGNFYQEPDTNSTKSVAFRNATGTDIFIVDSTNQRIGVGVSDPDSKVEILGTGTQLKLSNNADDSASFAVGTNGDLTITTVDAAGSAAGFVVVADGLVDIDANAGALSLDGSGGINIGTEADVAIDINASTLDIDASDNITITAGGSGKLVDIDASGTLSLDSATGIDIGTNANKPIDINSSTLDIDATGPLTIDGTSTVSIGAVGEIDLKSDTSVLIMSGGSGNSPLPNGADTNFFVSGSINSKNSTTKGTSVFGGDLVISGNLHGASPLKVSDDIALTGSARFKEQSAPSAGQNEAVLYAKDVSGVTKLFTKQSDGLEVGPLGSGGALDDAYDTPIGGGTKSPGVGAVITADAVPVQIKVAGTNTVGLAVTGSVVFGSGSTGLGSSGLPAIPGADTHFFVSGSKGGRGTFGTSVFGGDLVASGTITKVDQTGNASVTLDGPGVILSPGSVVEFGDPGENIFGDGTDLFISSSRKAHVVAIHGVVLDSSNGVVDFEKSGTEFFKISRVSGDVVLQPRESNKDIIFHEDGGDEVFRVDSSAKDILMAAGNNVSFGAATRFIGDGTDYNSDANAVVVAGSNDVIIGPGVNGQAFMSLGTNGQFVVADGEGPTNYLMITGSSLGGILSASVHNKNISIHSNNGLESFSITGGGNAIFNDPGPLGTDTVFTVSGAIDSRGTTTRGTAVFGGDLVVSGGVGINTVTVTSDGKVGIGTNNPSVKLEVGGNAAFGSELQHRGDDDTFIQFAEDAIGIDAGGERFITISQLDAGQDIVKIGDGGDIDFQVRTLADDNTLYVHGSSDRVGIGTNSPVSILHVKESAPTVSIQRESNANDSTIAFLGQSGFTGAIMHLSKSNDLVFKTHDGTSPHEIMRLGSHYASDVRQVILLSGSKMAASSMQPKESADINFFVSGSKQSRGTSDRGTAVFGGDVAISGSLYKSVTTYAFFQSGTPTGNPTNEFHFEWGPGTVNSGDPEANAQNDFWMFFPKGGRILDITARGGSNDDFSASNPYSQRLVVAMYLWGDDWINSSNNVAHGGYTAIGHVTSSIPSDDVANESGTYSHKAVWNMDYEYFRNNATGSFEIPSGKSISLAFKGIDTAGALANTNFFITVERDL